MPSPIPHSLPSNLRQRVLRFLFVVAVAAVWAQVPLRILAAARATTPGTPPAVAPLR